MLINWKIFFFHITMFLNNVNFECSHFQAGISTLQRKNNLVIRIVKLLLELVLNQDDCTKMMI